jgi:hypothetical protein
MPEEAVQAAEAAEEATPVVEDVKDAAPETAQQPEAPVEVAVAALDAPLEEKAETPAEARAEEAPVNHEDVSYQAVEKEGTVTAIWEMQGQRHLRTIDPRSNEGKQILALFETAG